MKYLSDRKTLAAYGTVLLFAIAAFLFAGYLIGSAMNYQMEKFYKSQNYSKEDFECMSKTIYYEAGNQSVAGKEAVGLVVMNRVFSGKSYFGNTVCDVVESKASIYKKTICQFSYFCEHLPPPYGKQWEESMKIADLALQNYFSKDVVKQVGDALYFHADYIVKPSWTKKMKRVAQIDDHIFYEESVDKKKK